MISLLICCKFHVACSKAIAHGPWPMAIEVVLDPPSMAPRAAARREVRMAGKTCQSQKTVSLQHGVTVYHAKAWCNLKLSCEKVYSNDGYLLAVPTKSNTDNQTLHFPHQNGHQEWSIEPLNIYLNGNSTIGKSTSLQRSQKGRLRVSSLYYPPVYENPHVFKLWVWVSGFKGIRDSERRRSTASSSRLGFGPMAIFIVETCPIGSMYGIFVPHFVDLYGKL